MKKIKEPYKVMIDEEGAYKTYGNIWKINIRDNSKKWNPLIARCIGRTKKEVTKRAKAIVEVLNNLG